jgi:hypothetical protein
VERKSLFDHFFEPWKQSWRLIRERADFASFQVGFMLGGTGLMVLQPALPMFFVDVLNLSYVELSLALAACKGIGFVIASPSWLKLFRRFNIFYLSGLVTALAALFPFLLLSAQSHLVMLYIAYGLYGIMQAGSELSWHMSGPVFAKEHDSSPYSATNVLTVGIRGCVAPLFGAFLYSISNSATVMILGSVLCLLATRHLVKYSQSYSNALEEA